MTSGFWEKISVNNDGTKKPIFCLAPLYHVTDAAFREIIATYGKPDVMFTEFASVEGLTSDKGRDKLLHLLKYTEKQRPIVAQIWGINPANFKKTAKMIKDMGFDGIDINFGCPDKNVVKYFAGCGVINNPELATQIIEATKEGAGDLPVSVKTRIGYNQNIVEEWTEHILKSEPAALTLHLRTKKEMSKVPAHWEEMKKAVAVRDRMNSKTLIIGNGDVLDLEDGLDKIQTYGSDGVMLGRAIFGNPWRFNKEINKTDLPIEQILHVLLEHTKLFELWIGEFRPFDLMKKHFASYISGFDNIKKLKIELMECKNSGDVEKVINSYLRK